MAQVELDVPLHLSGPQEVRTVTGLAQPTSVTSLLSRTAHDKGLAHWATATVTSGTFNLTVEPAPFTPIAGTLLRFVAPGTAFGQVFIRVNNNASARVQTTDGLDPVLGDIVEGMVLEVIWNDDGWTLMTPPLPGCPPNTVSINERYCIDVSRSANNLDFFDAMDYCAARGGRLCRWDEYHYACFTAAASLSALFTDWEWIDASSNHVHIGDQVGRTSCFSQRSQSPNALNSTRCCYSKR